jgi:hypothetical protein
VVTGSKQNKLGYLNNIRNESAGVLEELWEYLKHIINELAMNSENKNIRHL